MIILSNGQLATCSSDKTTRFWDITQGGPKSNTCVKSIMGHTGYVCALIELPNNQLITGSHDKTIKVWDLNTYKELRVIKEKDQGRIMIMIVISKDEIAVGSEKDIRIYNFLTGACVKTIKGHTGLIRDLYLAENNLHLYSGSDDKMIKVWDVKTGKCLKTLSGHNHSANQIVMFQKNILVSASDDSNIKFWDVETGTCVHTLKDHTGWVIWITVLKNGEMISVGSDKNVRFWKGDKLPESL